MASNETELKLKLAAEGGAASAKEVTNVKDAASQLSEVMGDLRAEMIDAGKSAEDVETALAPLQQQLNAIVDAMADQAEMEAASEALREQASAMADSAQAAAKLRAEQEAAAAIAKEQADAYAAEQAELKRLEEAYEATQIAAAELSAKQAEAAKAETEKAAQRQQTAIENLGKSVRGMIPGYSDLMGRVTRLRDAWREAGTSGATMGQKLAALAGGPVAVGVAAFAAITAGVAAYRAKMRDLDNQIAETDASLRESEDAIKKQGDAAAESAGKNRDYATALDELAATHEANAEKWERAKDRAELLAKAQDNLNRAVIEGRVASGEISKEEGAALQYEQDIASIERELAAERERAELEKNRADETARLAAEFERKSAADLASAQGAASNTEAQRTQFKNRSDDANQKAKQLRTSGASAEGLIEALGGEEEVLRRIGLLTGVSGYVSRRELDDGASLERVLGDGSEFVNFTRNALAAQLAEEARLADLAEKSRKEEVETAAKTVEEKRKSYEAAKATREAAEAEQAKANAAREDVAAREQIARGYTIPALETRADTSRQESQRAKEEEAKKAYDAGRKEVDQEISGVAKQMEGLIKAQGLAGTESGPLLQQVLELMKGGTDYNESGTIRALLEGFATSVKLQAEVKAEIAAMETTVRNIHAQLRNLESQNRYAANRQ